MTRLLKNSIEQMKHFGTSGEGQVIKTTIKRAIWILINQDHKSKRRWSTTSMRGLISDENFCLNKDIESAGGASGKEWSHQPNQMNRATISLNVWNITFWWPPTRILTGRWLRATGPQFKGVEPMQRSRTQNIINRVNTSVKTVKQEPSSTSATTTPCHQPHQSPSHPN
jgi:hypothetical protein